MTMVKEALVTPGLMEAKMMEANNPSPPVALSPTADVKDTAPRTSVAIAESLELQLRRADDLEQKGFVAAANELRAEAMMSTAGEYAAGARTSAGAAALLVAARAAA